MGIQCPKCKSDNPSESVFCAKCGTQIKDVKKVPPQTETLEAPKDELTTGSSFAERYQIIEEIGTGGMGKVYKDLDTEIHEKIALKLLKPEISGDRKTIERFQYEMKLARKISHKNVCRMYHLAKDKGKYYITMEYVHGDDLKSMIRMTRHLSIGAVLSIGKQICDGLEEAHSLGIVHRDLKPQNIMIDRGGNVKIMDFGIARSLREKGITDSGIMIGTPEYMSPEQTEAKDIDLRTDIYSLGIILFEMATGKTPFEGDTALSIAMKHKGEVPQDPKELNPNIPDDLSWVIRKCLEKDKKDRFQSVDELRTELVKIEKGIPTTERIVPEKKPLTSREITVTFGLKKFWIPAAIFIAVVIIGIVIWKLIPRGKTVLPSGGRSSIAVLPFSDLSPQKDQEYLCDGLAGELIVALSNIKDLHVVARTSAFSFKGKDLDIRDIGQQLNAQTVLEGSVMKSGAQLRIAVQLVDVEDGYQIWSERFDRGMDDVFKIQDEITLAIVKKLKVKLLGEERTKLVKRQTENIEAYNLYLKGRFYWNKRNEEEVKKGIEHLNQAIEEDPSFAGAYAGLADCYNVLGFYSALPPKDAFPKAKAAAIKAMELDEELAEAHTSLAYAMLYHDWDWEGAEREFRRAEELNPDYATTPHWLAEYFAAMGMMNEAIVAKKRASQLDPLSMIINTTIGWMYYFDRRYDEAVEQIKRVQEIDPNFVPAHFWIGQAYEQKGLYPEAVDAFKNAVTLSRESTYTLASLAHGYASAGDKARAREILSRLRELSKAKYVSAYEIAEVYISLGEIESAFEWLEKAYEERSRALVFLKVEPRLDPIRSDPRFKTLLDKMNLE